MKRKAVYPGSFDPITWGHVDCIDRALKIFDEVHIVVGVSPQKNGLFTVKERMDLISQSLKDRDRVIVQEWSGLIVDYALQNECQALVRGLRAASDFEYEFMMTAMNRELNESVETVFFCTNKDLFFVSSSMVKEVAQFGADISQYVPPTVEEALKIKFKN